MSFVGDRLHEGIIEMRSVISNTVANTSPPTPSKILVNFQGGVGKINDSYEASCVAKKNNICPTVPASAHKETNFQNNSIDGKSLYSSATLIISSLFGLSDFLRSSIILSISFI